MARLQIRSTSAWLNRFRKIHLYVDGQKGCSVGYGQMGHIDLPAGEHLLQAQIDWCGSAIIPVHINHDDILDVEITGFRHSGWLMPSSGILAIFSLLFGQELGIPSWLALLAIAPGSFLMIYHLTFGRLSYLRLALSPESSLNAGSKTKLAPALSEINN